jgi:hypothetical protein
VPDQIPVAFFAELKLYEFRLASRWFAELFVYFGGAWRAGAQRRRGGIGGWTVIEA